MLRVCWLAWVALVAALALVATAQTARAQSSFSFSIGTGHYGHHGHHHHHDWCDGPYWGPGWYGPGFGVVYAPPPVVKERVIYVQPQQPAWAPAPASVSAAPAAPVVANTLPASTAAEDDRIVIRNMSGAQLPVAFLVDGQDVELSDGATRTFVGKTRRNVAYDRGGRFGSTEQQLTAGQYEFRITASGWDLVRRPDLTPSGRTVVRSNTLPAGR